MGKPIKTKRPEILGKGKVTAVQIAFIVDRYLSDNNYIQTRSNFRTEASTLISKTHIREAPKSLLSLSAILDEYISLKEQKVMLEQEKRSVEQEKYRVETLLKGMQGVMQAYNSAGNTSLSLTSAAAPKSMSLIPPSDRGTPSPAAGFAMSSTPNTHLVPRNSNTISGAANFSTPTNDLQGTNKRKGLRTVTEAPPMVKRPCSQMPRKLSPIGGSRVPLQSCNITSTQETVKQFAVQSSPPDRLPNGSTIQGSSVVKSLFKQSSEPPLTNPPDPKTPPQALTSSSEKTVSPLDGSSHVYSTGNTQKTTPRSCSLDPSEAVNSSPFKHITYYSKETNHYISSSPIKSNLKKPGKRDHVKGRLNFDGSDAATTSGKSTTAEIFTPGPNEELDIFDMDIPNFDIFGADFSLSELLIDIDIDCEGDGLSSLQTSNPSMGSPNGSISGSLDANEVLSEVSTTVTEVLSEKDMNIQGLDSLTSVKSVTKSITISSPAKRRSSLLDQENLLVQD
ncbi:hypothetical protein NE237_009939 [Protea cynaroides]|uniref:Uncharacterized protein n=1 Tax=Protea cynaroides TaxID=273540 RepID=A0A9Q0KYU6_9MAGN|nr:hypothetical protein NE237_009939 [Protea cynaroides]